MGRKEYQNRYCTVPVGPTCEDAQHSTVPYCTGAVPGEMDGPLKGNYVRTKFYWTVLCTVLYITGTGTVLYQYCTVPVPILYCTNTVQYRTVPYCNSTSIVGTVPVSISEMHRTMVPILIALLVKAYRGGTF